MKPTQVATLLIGAALSGVAFAIPFGAAVAGANASAEPPIAAPGNPGPGIRVYLFRGFAGMVFSRGTDKLAGEIEQAGFKATVNEAMMCPVVAKEAIRDYRAEPALIVVIGHSVGGACALEFANLLNAENIPVSLAVTTDPARITPDVPANVERYINVFQSDTLLGGHDVGMAQGFQGHFASFDIAQHKEVTHVNMDKNETINQQVLSKIEQLAATPAKTDGEVVPLRYAVPGDADIELWDSGTPIFARPGDTLQSLAMLYHVPPWSLAQMNTVSSPDMALSSGQRIVVPRHLVALAAASNGATTGRAPLKH
jgi:fermentation-respiration switch protein FrsA (DUF1100 family)